MGSNLQGVSQKGHVGLFSKPGREIASLVFPDAPHRDFGQLAEVLGICCFACHLGRASARHKRGKAICFLLELEARDKRGRLQPTFPHIRSDAEEETQERNFR